MRTTPPKKTRGRYGESIRRISLQQRYLEQMTAPDLLSLRDEISLVGAKIALLLEKLDANSVNFPALYEIHQTLQAYIDQADAPGIAITANQLGALIAIGLTESEVWKDLYVAIEQRRKLVETEMKTLNSIGALLSMEQVMLLVGKLVAAVTLHISDKPTLTAIHGEFERVLDLAPNPAYETFSDFSAEEQ